MRTAEIASREGAPKSDAHPTSCLNIESILFKFPARHLQAGVPTGCSLPVLHKNRATCIPHRQLDFCSILTKRGAVNAQMDRRPEQKEKEQERDSHGRENRGSY